VETAVDGLLAMGRDARARNLADLIIGLNEEDAQRFVEAVGCLWLVISRDGVGCGPFYASRISSRVRVHIEGGNVTTAEVG
jgi:hypothetical protein